MRALRVSVLSLTLAARTCFGQIRSTSTASSSAAATSAPCGVVAAQVEASASSSISVDAELALQCLKSVPINEAAANFTMDSVIRMVQFQSTLAFLKDPPSGYANPAVDIMADLKDIWSKLAAGQYQNEYDWEGDVSNVLDQAFDGHLAFEGFAWSGAFTWRRNRDIALGIASVDGALPKVWCIRDFNATGASFTPSAVSKINGQDVLSVLQQMSLKNLYHDPDARWNTLALLQAAGSSGTFVNPSDYPGASTSLTFENGTTSTYPNFAVVNDPGVWSTITNGKSFYNTLISPTGGASRKRQVEDAPRKVRGIPKRLQFKKTVAAAGNGSVPETYPSPFFQHSNPDIGIAGFFVDDPAFPNLGVLMVQTFSTADTDDTQEWQRGLQNFIAEAKTRGTKKIIIDVRDNGGGKIFLGYETFKQFFPSTEAFGGNRYRAHTAANILGSQISTLELRASTANAVTSPFDSGAYLDENLEPYQNWNEMFGPKTFKKDNFTNILRYNLSDPMLTSDPTFGIGITITGYGDRSNFTEAPFSSDDIIILSDGACASTCALFVEMMVHQAGVQTMTIGGRPQTGPMQVVGGTKGSQVLTSEYLIYLSNFVFSYFKKTTAVATFWDSVLPVDFSIKVDYASVNFQDNIRQGQTSQGIPTQFINDTSNCRIWYTPTMYLNVTEVWSTVAEVAWGNGNAVNEDRCVSGSFSARDSSFQGTTTAGGSGSGSGSDNNAEPTSSEKASSALPSMIAPSISMTALACGAVLFVSLLLGSSTIIDISVL